MIMELPNDFNSVELELYGYLMGTDRLVPTVDVYAKITDPTDKFLIAYIFELGNTRKLASEAIGLSRATVWKRLKEIKRTLESCYKI